MRNSMHGKTESREAGVKHSISAPRSLIAALAITMAITGCQTGTTTLTTDDGRKLVFDKDRNLIVEQPACRFSFTADIHKIVAPVIEEKLGSTSAAFDLEHAGITYYRDYAALTFEPKPSTNADSPSRYPVDAEVLVIEIGVCDHRVRKAYFEIPGR